MMSQQSNETHATVFCTRQLKKGNKLCIERLKLQAPSYLHLFRTRSTTAGKRDRNPTCLWNFTLFVPAATFIKMFGATASHASALFGHLGMNPFCCSTTRIDTTSRHVPRGGIFFECVSKSEKNILPDVRHVCYGYGFFLGDVKIEYYFTL